MSDEHATVLYKGHRYQMRPTGQTTCAGCVFKRAGGACAKPSTAPEFECIGRLYVWIEVDEQGKELKPSTLTDNKGRATNIKTGVKYTVVYRDSCGECHIQTGMYKPSRDDNYLMAHNTCISCNTGIVIGLDDSKISINKNLLIEAVYTDEEFAKLIGVSL